MAIKQIQNGEWAAYFDAFSKGLIQGRRTDYAEIRVFSPEMGAQLETAWMPLTGITYDGRGDLIEVTVGNGGEHMDHRIYHPVEIYVDEGEGILCSMEVVRGDGTKEIVEFR